VVAITRAIHTIIMSEFLRARKQPKNIMSVVESTIHTNERTKGRKQNIIHLRSNKADDEGKEMRRSNCQLRSRTYWAATLDITPDWIMIEVREYA
jgi:hypothetical protein